MEKNFLFYSYDGYIGDIAWRVLEEGNNVKLYIKNKKQADIGDGFVPKAGNFENEIDWADIIVFDDVLGQGKIAEDLKKRGKLVIGGSSYTDRLEDDRSFGQEELKKYGVKIIPYKNFFSFDEAIDYVRDNPKKYVIKPSGEAQNIKRLLYVGEEETGSDVVRVLKSYKKTWAKHIKEFQLQQKVDGVEVAVGAFFNGQNFIYPINVNFEHKKLFPGNIGPSTGEMGTSMFFSPPNELFARTLLKLEAKLRREKYSGYIDLNCMVNAKGVYPLEFTCRFGYPCIFIQYEGILNSFSEFLYKVAKGENFSFKVKNGFQVGARIIVPPYPFNDPETFASYSKNAAIILKKNDLRGIHFEDAKRINGDFYVAGTAGVVLCVVGCGKTMREAQKQMFKRIENIIIPNKYFRRDIGDRWFEDSDCLHNWGYLRSLISWRIKKEKLSKICKRPVVV